MKDLAAVIAHLSPEKRAQLLSKLNNRNSNNQLQQEEQSSHIIDGDFAFRFRSERPFDFEPGSCKIPDPADDFVQIEARAVSLNFRDLMIASRLYPSFPGLPSNMGSDYSGIVIKTGKNITHVKEGDEVIALAAGHTSENKLLDNFHFATRVNVHKDCVAPKPANISFHEASCIPTVFLTSYIGLVHMGRLSKNDKVLIHTATGGVGLSAIQVAKSVGATIFATAGSENKRAYLKSIGIEGPMDSRSLDFEQEIMRRTQEEGINVVFNTLSGTAIDAGLRLLQPFGRFIHIDKKDIASNRPLNLGAIRNGLSFCYLDISLLFFERRLLRKCLHEIVQLFEEGVYNYAQHKVFPLTDFKKALTEFSHSAHIGKFVLSYEKT